MPKDLTRKELYNLVWKKPITEIAKEYGLSDRGLGKLCERESIPTPPRGYWAKVKSGQKIKKPPLLMSKSSDRTVLSEVDKTVEDEEKELSIELKELIEYEENPENKIIIPKRTPSHHSIVKKNQVHRKQWGRRSAANIESRRDRILSCFLFALEYRKYVIDDESSFYKIKVSSGEEFIFIGMSEYIKRTKRETTEEERTKSYYGKWTYDDIPTGFLELSIYCSSGRKIERIIESEKKPMEELLNKAMIDIHKDIVEQRERKRYWEEERRKSFERQQRISKEKENRENLLTQANNWYKAKNIREYVGAVKQNHLDSEKINSWSEWALDYADIIDPTKEKRDTLFDYDY